MASRTSPSPAPSDARWTSSARRSAVSARAGCNGGDSLDFVVAHRGVEALAQDVDHVGEVRIVPHEWQPHVAGLAEHLGREGERVLRGRESPVDEISGRNLITCSSVRSCKRLNWRESWTGVMPGVRMSTAGRAWSF